jgi:hypothetical protein
VVVALHSDPADVALTSDIPVNEYRPDGPEGSPHREALDDRLDLRSGELEPEQPEDGLWRCL